MKVIKLIFESITFAFNSLKVNKLRTLLSLLGITIGIFLVILVFTLVDSLEHKIRSSIDTLGNDAVFIQKWPWGFGGEYPWWKYYQRPVPGIDEMEKLKDRTHTATSMAFMISTQREVHFNDKKMEGASIIASSYDYKDLMPLKIERGRYLTSLEAASGKSVCLIGADVAENIFQNKNPVSKSIKVFGRKLKIIGVLEKEGEDMFNQSSDNMVFIPINFASTILDTDKQSLQPTIIAKPKENISVDEMIDELRGNMRAIRKLKPQADDNFAINKITTLKDNFENLFSTLSVAGWFIGGLALLVGGFGIANIMFVSVKERTKLIGIKKALGAKNYYILSEFLFESVFLSLIGGIFGLLIVYAIVVLVKFSFELELFLSLENIMVGTGVSLIIGLLAGLIPAISASRLSPVEAIRTN